MNISRVKFILLFLVFGFAFLFGTSLLLNQPHEAILGSDTQQAWQSAVSTALSPIKAMLIGPMLPFINFLNQDPDAPPPFYLIGFAAYWALLATALHYIVRKFSSVSH